MALDLIPISTEEQKTKLQLVPLEGAMSRKELANFGVTGKTSAKQRKIITDTMRRRADSFRPDGTKKGKGFLGELKLPDGRTATEYSVGVQLQSRDGAETDIPTLVPTLTQKERDSLVNDIIPNRKPMPDAIMQKAIDHANKRVGEGKDVFYQEGEGVFQGGGGKFRGRGAQGSFAPVTLGEKLISDPIMDILGILPFSPLHDWRRKGATEAKRKLRTGDYGQRQYAMGGHGFPAFRPARPKQTTADLDKIVRDQAELESRGETIPAAIGGGIAELPAYMVEMMAGGIGKVKSVLGAAKFAGKMTVLQPARIESAMIDQIDRGETGGMALLKAWGDIYIENISETAGAGFGKAISSLPFGGKLMEGMRKFAKSKGISDSEFWKTVGTKVGYNGILAEWGEERIGTYLRGLTSVQDFGAGKDATADERIAAGFKQDLQVRNMMIETGILLAPGIAKYVGKRIIGKREDVTVKQVAKELGVPIKGLTPEAAVKKIDDVMRNRQALAPTEAVPAPDAAVEPSKAKEPTITPERAKKGTVAEKEVRIAERDKAVEAKAAEPVDVELYIGNVTPSMKKRMAEDIGVSPKAVHGFKKEGFPTKRTKFSMTRQGAENYREWLENDLLRRLEENEIRTDNDVAKASADFGDIKNLRAALGMKADIRMPFKVTRAKQKDVAVRDQGEIDALSKELVALDKQLQKAKTEAEQQPILSQIQEKEELLSQLEKTKGRAIKVIKDTRSAIWQAVKGETEAKLTMSQALNIVMKRSAQFAARAHTAAGKELVAKHKELLDFAKQELPAEYSLLKRASTRIVKSRTPSQIKAVEPAIAKMVEQYDKKQAIKTVEDAIKKAKAANPRTEFAKMLKGLEGISLKTSRESTIKKMKSLLKAAEKDEHKIGAAEKDDLKIGAIPQRLVDKAEKILADTKKPTLQDFSVGELKVLTDAIASVIHLNKMKNRFLSAKTERTREEILGKKGEVDLEEVERKLKRGDTLAVKEYIAKVFGTKQEVSPVEGDETWFSENWPETFSWLKKVATQGQVSYDTLAYILGGENSPLYKILVEDLQATLNKEQDIKDDFRDFMLKAGVDEKVIEESGKAKKGVIINLPESRNENGKRVEAVKLSKGELLDFAKIIVDPYKREQLLRNKMEGIRLGRQGKKGHSVSISKVDMKAILDAVPQEIKDHMKDWHEYTNGRTNTKYNLKEEVGNEWLKEHGFPATQHDNWSTGERYAEAIESKKHDPMRKFSESYLEDMTIFKEQKRNNAPYVLRNGYARMVSQVSQMAAYASKATAMNDAYSILHDRGFQETVCRAFKNGDTMLKNMEKALVKFTGRDYIDQGILSSLVKSLAPRAHVGALVAKPYIMFYQPMSLINALNEIPARYLLIPRRPKNVKRMRKQLNETSPTLRARDEASGAQIMNPVQAENALPSFFGFEKKRLKGIHKTDSVTIAIIGLGAEAEGKAKGITGEPLTEYTTRRTEEIVYRTQPTWDPLTISMLAMEGRDNAFAHQLVMFSSQRAKNTNTMVREIVKSIQDKRLGKKVNKAKVVKAVVLSQIAQSMAIWSLRALYFIALGKVIEKVFDVKRKKYEKDWRYYVFGLTGQMLGNWLVVGDVLDLALRAVTGTDEPGTRARGTILAEMLWKTKDSVSYLVEGIGEHISGEEYISGPHKDEAKALYDYSRAFEAGLTAAGPMTGLPTQSIVIHTRPFFPHRKEIEDEKKAKRGTRSGRSGR